MTNKRGILKMKKLKELFVKYKNSIIFKMCVDS